MSEQAASVQADSDAALMAASLAQPERFAVVFDRHYNAVHRYLARRAGTDAADDLASRTFVVAFEARTRFRSESASARPWLLGIATNLLHERRRADQRDLSMITRLQAERSDTLTDGGRGEEPSPSSHLLADALASLEREQRDALLLLAWAELSYEEIAQALDVPLGTVRSRLSRARSHLRAQLQSTPITNLEPENT